MTRAQAREDIIYEENEKLLDRSSQASKLDKAQAIGYYKIMKKYWLLDYFIIPHKDLAPSYIKKVEKFLKCLKKKQHK